MIFFLHFFNHFLCRFVSRFQKKGKTLQLSADYHVRWPLCKSWEHSFSVSDLVSVHCQINSYTTCVATITTITTTVARLPLFPIFLYRHHRPSNATTSIALCAITKNRFYHLRLPTRLRKTLHSTQRLCMSNMPSDMKIVHKILSERF